MFKKRFPLIYRHCILQLIIRWFALGRSSMIFLWLLNMIVLYFFFPEVRSWIQRQLRYFFVEGLHLSDRQINDVRDEIQKVFQQYVLIFSLIYTLVAVFDFFFATILFLSIWSQKTYFPRYFFAVNTRIHYFLCHISSKYFSNHQRLFYRREGNIPDLISLYRLSQHIARWEITRLYFSDYNKQAIYTWNLI